MANPPAPDLTKNTSDQKIGLNADSKQNSDADAKASDTTPIRLIYDQINSLFGNGPARLLEQGNYQYAGSDGIYAEHVKPPSVAEAEYRLSNDMFDISNIVGGANGAKVATQSITHIIDGGSDNEVALRLDQEKICAWLEEEVDNFEPPVSDLLSAIPDELGLRAKKPPKIADDTPRMSSASDSKDAKNIARVDLYQKLFDAYNAERFRWIQLKNDARPKDFSKPSEKHFGQCLSFVDNVRIPISNQNRHVDFCLAQDHRVRQYIGYVDIESASEMLQRAKENLRSSVVRSIDDTEDVYPVVLTPSNWAKHLSTNFKPQDLLNDEGQIRSQLYDAEKNRTMLLSRRNVILAGFSDTVIKLVQLYFEAATKDIALAADAVKKISEDKVDELNESFKEKAIMPLSKAQFKKLRDSQASCLQRQAALSTASEAYIRASIESAKARSNDGTNLVAQLQDQIDSLTLDIEYYKKILAESPNALPAKVTKSDGKTVVEPQAKDAVPVIPPEPQLPPQSEGASVWQEIVLSYKKNENASTSLSSTSVAHKSWETGLWFWSASGKSDTASSATAETHSAKNTDIKIGFRVMKVSIQRPWMNAAVLDQSENFYRPGEGKVSLGMPSELKKDLASRTAGVNDSEAALLPGWATSFVVAKDVHIIMNATESFDSSTVSDMQKSANTGGGFLCFSASKSSASSDHREGAVVTSDGKNLSIKIAAPQILGWITELAPADHYQSDYKPFPENEFLERVKKDPTTKPHLPPTPPPTPPT
ncbi:MAG: hypothetical protein M1825_003163 [Sarcosagium campestre]|nr:MAG: hypothetical protein M1825_003163 [Sarcosagium campestre]